MQNHILLDADAPEGDGGSTPSTGSGSGLSDNDKVAVDQLRGHYGKMKDELAKVIIGSGQRSGRDADVHPVTRSRPANGCAGFGENVDGEFAL